jgi:hypothetical protein
MISRYQLTWLASERPTQASGPPHQLSAPCELLPIIAPPIQPLLTSSKASIHLAISAINRSQIQSVRDAAQTFKVPQTTLQRRRARKPAQRDCLPNSRKLTQLEEEVIISYIVNLDQRGFSPTYAAIRDMANKLLAARDAGQVSQK